MKTALTSLLGLLLMACGPIYDTQYHFRPPADAPGRACVAQCEASRTQCKVTADLRAENTQLKCEAESRYDYERCLGNAKGDEARRSCYRRSCSASPDYASCQVDHRSCFEGCGGVVEVERLCTLNCP